MHDIYKHGFCNIAASASTNPREGLFRARDLSLLYPIPIKLCKTEMKLPGRKQRMYDENCSYSVISVWGTKACQTLSFQPLNSRAWVSKERLLSPQILHFGSEQIFYESKELFFSETSPDQPLTRAKTDHAGDFNFRSQMIEFNQATPCLIDHVIDKLIKNNHRKPYRHTWATWHKIIASYTRCAITRPSDRLVAISAIARHWKSRTRSEYLAGLWKDNLIHDLGWSKRGTANADVAEYVAPSWSWACTGGDVGWRKTSKAHEAQDSEPPRQHLPLVKIVCAIIEAVGDDKLGQVKSGVIELQGMLARAVLTQAYTDTGPPTDVRICPARDAPHDSEKEHIEGYPRRTYIDLDAKTMIERTGLPREVDLDCRILPMCVVENRVWGLILAKADDHPEQLCSSGTTMMGYYKRVGRFESLICITDDFDVFVNHECLEQEILKFLESLELDVHGTRPKFEKLALV